MTLSYKITMGKKYLLVGGEFENKGAEAMTFSTIQYLRQTMGNVEIYMLIDTKHMDLEMLELCGIKSVFDQPSRRMYAAGGLERLSTYIRGKNRGDYRQLDTVLNEMDAVIDISGFAFTSVWGVIPTISACALIKAAKKKHIDYYIMPQSFGPFSYPDYIRPIMLHQIKIALASVKHIFAREDEGYSMLTHDFGLKNVERSCDMVLQQKSYDTKYIFEKQPKMSEVPYDIPQKSVAIVPSIRLGKFMDEKKQCSIYHTVISGLLQRAFHVFLIAHSSEDLPLCVAIKNQFQNDEVILIEQNLSCIEYENVIKGMSFCIASRYHSIVNAYKMAVPCVALGWATKYKELLMLFEQEPYLADIRSLQEDALEKICLLMEENYLQEKDKIIHKLPELQTGNCLEIIH